MFHSMLTVLVWSSFRLLRLRCLSLADYVSCQLDVIPVTLLFSRSKVLAFLHFHINCLECFRAPITLEVATEFVKLLNFDAVVNF